ncbi:hypothetical protein GCM10008014_33110 [Paenibacillus silvae]|uniref:Uncharacterized protein n=1 Tax=Paenibacillus silvae TaxID=1325358 RepID=A0ABQ1ZDI6_9BACL|nr:hypothetical protein GCM10008014_33110 [Paenibacillus silvae]
MKFRQFFYDEWLSDIEETSVKIQFLAALNPNIAVKNAKANT